MKEQTLNLLLCVVVGVLLSALLVVIFSKPKQLPPVETVRTDTVFVVQTRIDTVRYPVPVPKIVRAVDTVFVRVTDTLVVPLVRESKEYLKPEFHAIVSGIQPSLDFIEVFQKTTTVTQTVTETTRTPAPRWSFGVTFGLTAGYGLTPAGAQPYIGAGATVGIQYRF